MPDFLEKGGVMKKPNRTELTLKQQRFANEYCVDLNATAAYRRAGYNARGNAAEACASRLLSNVKVQQAIQQKEKISASRCEVNTENVLREASALAFSDIRKLFNTDGSPKSIHELDDATAAAIKSIEVGQMMSEGKVIGRMCKIKLWDKNSAQERLFKHLRLFDKDNSQGALALKGIAVSFVSPDGEVMGVSDIRKPRQG
ncbi:terminase small subunit [Nitrosovibrio sp. Nv4]|uniref:terminase small subunit n=1 Tax=Nitrosovibrio sp. Nv4 TaxID=1945880 RepID=UPI000BC50ABA|nr:terminase small subunit [Nitrosovibrio sp. Nv4]SOD42716.1 phage terminase small subunit [Nitrosovibrio sp. Nv4]